MKLLSTEEILRKRKRVITERIFVYFLFKDKKIIYIGSTSKGLSRVFIHLLDKRFDSYSIIPCTKEERFDLESQYLLKYHPPENSFRILPQNSIYISIDQIKKTYCISRGQIKKVIWKYCLKSIYDDYYLREFYSRGKICAALEKEGYSRRVKGGRECQQK